MGEDKVGLGEDKVRMRVRVYLLQRRGLRGEPVKLIRCLVLEFREEVLRDIRQQEPTTAVPTPAMHMSEICINQNKATTEGFG